MSLKTLPEKIRRVLPSEVSRVKTGYLIIKYLTASRIILVISCRGIVVQKISKNGVFTNGYTNVLQYPRSSIYNFYIHMHAMHLSWYFGLLVVV